MKDLKLYLSMYGTLALLIGITSIFIFIMLHIMGFFNIFLTLFLIIVLNLLQWLFAPYIIESIYNVKEIDRNRWPWIYDIVEKLSQKNNINTPRIMISDIPIPNAFAYGSPLTGNRIAITKGLLSSLTRNEIEAVIGHEFGHIVHKDMQIMMMVSLLPAILYYIGRMFLFTRDDEDRGSIAILGFISIFLSQILYFLVLGLSRFREYYADEFSAKTIENGARKLQLALIKIVKNTSFLVNRGFNVSNISGFRTLFIVDPVTANKDMMELELLEAIKSKKISLWENILELFSTHPNIVKRIRALDKYIE